MIDCTLSHYWVTPKEWAAPPDIGEERKHVFFVPIVRESNPFIKIPILAGHCMATSNL
jgi:hypothetical protein